MKIAKTKLSNLIEKCKKFNSKYGIYSYISSVLITCAMLLNYKNIYKKGIKAFKYPFVVSPLLVLIITVGIFFLIRKFKNEENKTNKLQKIFSFLMGIAMTLGYSYEKINSWNIITKNFATVIASIVSIIGMSLLFDFILNIFNDIVKKAKVVEDNSIGNNNDKKLDKKSNKNNKDNKDNKDKKTKKILELFNKKSFLTSFVLILIFWSIYTVAFYPGVLNPDSSFQILQGLNIHTKYSDWIIQLDPNVNITNHHPVLHTLMLGGFFKLGRLIVSDNFGLFLSTITQTLILASVLAYTIKYLKEINISSKFRAIVLMMYCVVPMYGFYSVTLVKDVIYTAFIILFIIQLHKYIVNYKDEKIPIKEMLKMFAVITVIALFRNNGKYVVILTLIFLAFYSIKNIKRMATILLLFLALVYSYDHIILPGFKISNTSIREALSVPFQQTARYTKEHKKELSKHEIEVIDKVLKYDDLAKRYNPRKSDPVKNEFNKYTTKEEMMEYFKVWMNGLKKHPDTYIQAFINNTYGYYYPTNNKWYIYYGKLNYINDIGNINYNYNSLQLLRNGLIFYGIEFRNTPVIGMISNIGFNTFLINAMAVYMLCKKSKRKYLIILLPQIVSILICLVSPVNNYFRYALPYIFSMPITVLMFLKEMNEDGKEE